MKRIILVLPDLPLPFGNAAARWYYVLARGLVERGHRVTTIASYDLEEKAEEVWSLFPKSDFDLRIFPRKLARGPWNKLDSLRRPCSYIFSHDFRHALRDELRKGCDALHLEQTWSGWLGMGQLDHALLNVHYLLQIDSIGTTTPTLSNRLLRSAELRAERGLLRRFPTITALTPRLTECVRRISPRSVVHTVPLAMDLSLYPFRPPPRADPAGSPPTVGLIGSFNWQPTLSAGVRLLSRLWPKIRQQVPEARLLLVGRRARKALGDLASAAGPGVELHEDVPDTIPHFRATDVLVYAPVSASGMKVKVLEAFALGVPVVSTSEGVEGLPALDGVHAGVCEDDAGLVERACSLLRDPSRAASQARAARAMLEGCCSPGPTLDLLEDVYRTLGKKSTA